MDIIIDPKRNPFVPKIIVLYLVIILSERDTKKSKKSCIKVYAKKSKNILFYLIFFSFFFNVAKMLIFRG